MAKKKKITIKTIKKWSDEAQAEWFETNSTKSKVRNKIFAILEDKVTEITSKLLGGASNSSN